MPRKSKSKLPKTDGLGPIEKRKIRAALRLVWHRSYARALAVKRSIGRDGFHRCEKCGEKCPKVQIDHIVSVGEIDSGFIARLFCPSNGLRAWCAPCHRERTKAERKSASIRKMKF